MHWGWFLWINIFNWINSSIYLILKIYTLHLVLNISLLYHCWITTDNLVLSSPARPQRHKTGLNRCFQTTISSRFKKRLSCGKMPHQCIFLRIPLNLSGLPNMGSFLIIVIKLYSYIDNEVGNLRKFEYFCGFFIHSRNA